jgi:hypothetical protein
MSSATKTVVSKIRSTSVFLLLVASLASQSVFSQSYLSYIKEFRLEHRSEGFFSEKALIQTLPGSLRVKERTAITFFKHGQAQGNANWSDVEGTGSFRPAFTVVFYTDDFNSSGEKPIREMLEWRHDEISIYEIGKGSKRIYEGGVDMTEMPWWLASGISEMKKKFDELESLDIATDEISANYYSQDALEAFDRISTRQHEGGALPVQSNLSHLKDLGLTRAKLEEGANLDRPASNRDLSLVRENLDQVAWGLSRTISDEQRKNKQATEEFKSETAKQLEDASNNFAQQNEEVNLQVAALREQNQILNEQVVALIKSLESQNIDVPEVCKNPEDHLMVGKQIYELDMKVKDSKSLSQKERHLLYMLNNDLPIRFDYLTEVYIEAELARFNTNLPEEDRISSAQMASFYQDVIDNVPYRDPAQFKATVDSYLAAKTGSPIQYNRNASLLPYLMVSNQIECQSATANYQVLCREKLGASEFKNDQFVSIYESGHKLLGQIVTNENGEKILIGFESTAEGRGGPIQYGPIAHLSGAIRVVDAEIDLVAGIFYDKLENATAVRDRALRVTSTMYGSEIDLNKFNKLNLPVKPLLPDLVYARQTEAQKIAEGVDSRSNLFSFGTPVVPAEVFERHPLNTSVKRESIERLSGNFDPRHIVDVDLNELEEVRKIASEKFENPKQDPSVFLNLAEFKVFLHREMNVSPGSNQELLVSEKVVEFFENFIRDPRYFTEDYLNDEYFQEVLKGKNYKVAKALEPRWKSIKFELDQIKELGNDYLAFILSPQREIGFASYVQRTRLSEQIARASRQIESGRIAWTPEVGTYAQIGLGEHDSMQLSLDEMEKLSTYIQEIGLLSRQVIDNSAQSQFWSIHTPGNPLKTVQIRSDGQDTTIEVSEIPSVEASQELASLAMALKIRLEELSFANQREFSYVEDQRTNFADIPILVRQLTPGADQLQISSIRYGEDEIVYIKTSAGELALNLQTYTVPVKAPKTILPGALEVQGPPAPEVERLPENENLVVEVEDNPADLILDVAEEAEEVWTPDPGSIEISTVVVGPNRHFTYHSIDNETRELKTTTIQRARIQPDRLVDVSVERNPLAAYSTQLTGDEVRFVVSSADFRSIVREARTMEFSRNDSSDYARIFRGLTGLDDISGSFRLKYYRSGILEVERLNSNDRYFVNLKHYAPEGLPTENILPQT